MSDLFGNHIVGFPTRRLIYRFTVDAIIIIVIILSLVEL